MEVQMAKDRGKITGWFMRNGMRIPVFEKSGEKKSREPDKEKLKEKVEEKFGSPQLMGRPKNKGVDLPTRVLTEEVKNRAKKRDISAEVRKVVDEVEKEGKFSMKHDRMLVAIAKKFGVDIDEIDDEYNKLKNLRDPDYVNQAMNEMLRG